MENKQANDLPNEKEQPPVIESEATKDSERVNAEKKNKEATVDDDLPGYPHYPPAEDMLNPSSDMERLDMDVENIARGGYVASPGDQQAPSIPPVNDMELPAPDDLDDEDDIGIVPGTEADVTKEDLLLLGDKDQDMDMGEDEELQGKGFPLGLTGDDLDIPGEDLDDASDAMGQGDEENDYYSLGGDSKEGLEDPE